MFTGSYDFCAVGHDIIPEYFAGDLNTDGPGIIVKILRYKPFHCNNTRC